MTKQRSLFDTFELKPVAPHAHGSRTSFDAARSMDEHLGQLQALVLEEFRKAGAIGLTCDEAEGRLHLKHQTASARIKELRDLRLLVAVVDERGELVTRRTSSNRAAQVWRAK